LLSITDHRTHIHTPQHAHIYTTSPHLLVLRQPERPLFSSGSGYTHVSCSVLTWTSTSRREHSANSRIQPSLVGAWHRNGGVLVITRLPAWPFTLLHLIDSISVSGLLWYMKEGRRRTVCPTAWRGVRCGSVMLSLAIIPYIYLLMNRRFGIINFFLQGLVTCILALRTTKETGGNADSCSAVCPFFWTVACAHAYFVRSNTPYRIRKFSLLGWTVCLGVGAHSIHGMGALLGWPRRGRVRCLSPWCI